MIHSVKTAKEACQGCVNCIKKCPTEAIRVVDGEISIISELCIDCGECLRACSRKALGVVEDDWNSIKESAPVTLIPDPVFFAQFSHYTKPEEMKKVLSSLNLNVLTSEMDEAFDLYAYAVARFINSIAPSKLPMISTYCPAVLRLIESRCTELLPRVVPVQSPLEMAADLWRMRINNPDKLTFLAPCPAKITMVREPQGREISPIDWAVTVKRLARAIMAAGDLPSLIGEPQSHGSNRWLKWALRGGESKHIQAFSDRKLTVLAVSGIRNAIDVLQEMELGRLRGVDFVECRVCDIGCVGGVATAESRFLASLRVQKIQANWNVTPKELARAEELFSMGFWPMHKELTPCPSLPLSDNVSDSMIKLRQMKEIYNALPHIDCGSCGRPSCQAMAEEIVRGHGSVTDCIFKLREGISKLANQIVTLSESQPHILKRKGTKR